MASMATNFGAKFENFAFPTYIQHAGIPKWIAGLQIQFQPIKRQCTAVLTSCKRRTTNLLWWWWWWFSASCRNLVKFSPVTTEFAKLETVTFGTIWWKLTYLTNYLKTYWTNLCAADDNI